MHAVIHAADIQDRDGGVLVMASLFGLYPFLLKLYADGGYQGPQFQAGLARVMKQVSVEIVKRSDIAKAFVVLPKRWIVERTIAWLNRCRRLAKDWECLTATPWHSCAGPPSGSCSKNFAGKQNDFGQTLRCYNAIQNPQDSLCPGSSLRETLEKC